MDYILNKNRLVFNVPGSIDFSQSVVFEFYNNEESGAEELPIYDITHTFYDMYPVIANYISTQIHLVKLRHNSIANPLKIWVKCKMNYVHSHAPTKGESNKFTFKDAIDELKNSPMGYELNFNGYDSDSHIRELIMHFGTSILKLGGEEEIKLDGFKLKKEKIKL